MRAGAPEPEDGAAPCSRGAGPMDAAGIGGRGPWNGVQTGPKGPKWGRSHGTPVSAVAVVDGRDGSVAALAILEHASAAFPRGRLTRIGGGGPRGGSFGALGGAPSVLLILGHQDICGLNLA